MLRILLVAASVACLGMTLQTHNDEPAPAAGVPLTLAEDRAARVKDVRYELFFSIPSVATAPITGRSVVRFRLEDPSKPLAFDFAGRGDTVGVAIDGRPVAAAIANEHVVIPPAALRGGENAITFEFNSADAALNRSPEFMYTLFVPARARLAFPCFDQPDIKATYRLSLDIPAAWQAVANGEETSRTGDGDRLRVEFGETKPVPTYLFAFGAGRFEIETAERGGRRMRMLHRETDAAKVARNRDAIFDLHGSALQWLERYTGIPYPWGKFDFLLIPSFQFGGMEHPGSIFYNASTLLLDPSATQNQKLGRASLIAHETAHMWFGDLVTMRWFNDVWMKEVFANFMAAKIVNPSFPEINHDLRFLLSHYPAAYEVDRTAGTNAIRQRLDNLNDAGSLYGAIIYQKAPIVMRQLEMTLGVDGLRDGLREYLRQYSFGNASWPDLIAMLDRRTADDLKTWSHAWVEEAGRPVVRTELEIAKGRMTSLAFSNRSPVLRSQRLQIAIGSAEGERVLPVTLDRRRVELTAARGLTAPRYVLPTGGGIGYGGFELDRSSRRYLLEHLEEIPDALTRGSGLVTLWEEMLEGRVTPEAMVDVLMTGLPAERDELNLQRMLSYLQEVYWRHVSASARRAMAPRLEALLRTGLDAGSTQSTRSSWFSTLRDTALTRETLQWLEKVWSQEIAIPGLELAEPDFIALAQELAVRGVPRTGAILDRQLERIQNPDRKARFVFVRPSLSGDVAVRQAFFASLEEVANRRREAWVLEAVAYLHHPLRAASAEAYIAPSLALLQDIQRTGDIFFPKRWMDATLSGHRSVRAARTVRTFLDALPAAYPERLRRVVLSSADTLFRTAR